MKLNSDTKSKNGKSKGTKKGSKKTPPKPAELAAEQAESTEEAESTDADKDTASNGERQKLPVYLRNAAWMGRMSNGIDSLLKRIDNWVEVDDVRDNLRKAQALLEDAQNTLEKKPVGWTPRAPKTRKRVAKKDSPKAGTKMRVIDKYREQYRPHTDEDGVEQPGFTEEQMDNLVFSRLSGSLAICRSDLGIVTLARKEIQPVV